MSECRVDTKGNEGRVETLVNGVRLQVCISEGRVDVLVEKSKVEMWMNWVGWRSGFWWQKLQEHLKRNNMVTILEYMSSQLFYIQTQHSLSFCLIF